MEYIPLPIKLEYETLVIFQQRRGHRIPLLVILTPQHCPLRALHLNGPTHCDSDMAMRPIPAAPAAPAAPISPRPPSTGAPTPRGAASPRGAALATPLSARRAKPPDKEGDNH